MPITNVLFDLDNTLYPPTSGLMAGVDVRISEYLARLLGVEVDEARAIQKHYYHTYGTTLSGLQRHHGVDAEHYMEYVHSLAIEPFVALNAELDALLNELRATKAVFTNAPAGYARRILQALGIERHFAHLFDIRFLGFRPKPDAAAYHSVLAALDAAGDTAILIEDTVQNLPPAKALGMTTILVGPAAAHPAADYAVPDALAATRLAIELTA